MSIYVVGDIQGCNDSLQQLLNKVEFSASKDRLWCVGDMINRGPQSLETLRFLKSLGTSFTGVLGNHDLHFLAIACGAYKQGKTQYLQSLLDAPDCQELFEWVRHLPLAHTEKVNTSQGDKTFLMVHAGIAPNWKFKHATKYAAEVEHALQTESHKEFLTEMYGNKPDIWDRDLTGYKRLRVITNILTRMRFCSNKGQLNFSAKGEADNAPSGYSPWFELQKPRTNKTILFGHWAMLNGKTNRNDIQGLDTGCVWGRSMTLLQLDTGERHQVACKLQPEL